MNTRCYCSLPLKRFENYAAASRCLICLISISDNDPHVYCCKTKECLYLTATGYQYNACTKCYQNESKDHNTGDSININDTNDKISFALNKSFSTLNAIS